jgi:hypothetical protein
MSASHSREHALPPPRRPLPLPAVRRHAANFTEVVLGDLTVWFSYDTPVAFRVQGQRPVVRRNVWRQTTGRHLNEIDGSAARDRVDADEFVRLWEEVQG